VFTVFETVVQGVSRLEKREYFGSPVLSPSIASGSLKTFIVKEQVSSPLFLSVSGNIIRNVSS
jgi:hypothetical protein